MSEESHELSGCQCEGGLDETRRAGSTVRDGHPDPRIPAPQRSEHRPQIGRDGAIGGDAELPFRVELSAHRVDGPRQRLALGPVDGKDHAHRRPVGEPPGSAPHGPKLPGRENLQTEPQLVGLISREPIGVRKRRLPEPRQPPPEGGEPPQECPPPVRHDEPCCAHRSQDQAAATRPPGGQPIDEAPQPLEEPVGSSRGDPLEAELLVPQGIPKLGHGRALASEGRLPFASADAGLSCSPLELAEQAPQLREDVLHARPRGAHQATQ